MRRLFSSVLLSLLCGIVHPVFAQDADLNRRTIDAIKGLLKQRPDDPTLYYYLAGLQAGVGDKADAIANLEKLATLGEGFLPTSLIGFDSLANEPGYLAAHAALEAKLPRVADAPVAFSLADKTLIPEGIAWDATTGDFFVGSIAQRHILRVDARGKATPFSSAADGLQPILGIAVDSQRRLLHAVSTSGLTEAGRKSPINEVVTYDLKAGKKQTAVRIAEAVQLNDVAVAPNGDLYATDSNAGSVWRIRDGKAQIFMPSGFTRGTNGVAISADGKTVYVAHSTGMVRLDADSAKLDRMPPPPRQTVAAIDGLYFHQGDLLGIQNVTNPGRVIRMRLSKDGTTITSVETLQSHHHPAFDEPTTGVVVRGDFYVLATTQVARFNEKGQIEKPESLKAPKVVRISLPG